MNESSVEIISSSTSETQDGTLRKTIISEGSLPISTLPSGSSLRQSLNQENTVQTQSCQTPQNQNLRPFAAATDLKCAPASEKQQTNQVAYQAAMPYPLIKPECKNPQYAAAMLDNMGGQNSEMSAVSLYFYDHLITSARKEVAETFHHISIVEMHHLEIFGTLAMLLGENPRLWSKRGRGNRYFFWSPGYLRYPPFPIAPPNTQEDPDCRFTPPGPNPPLKTLLSQAIASEQEALNKYMQQTTWIKDVNICDNLRRIAADEQMHIEILTRLYHKY